MSTELKQTGWEAALEIALEDDKNVQRLCQLVIEGRGNSDEARRLAKQLSGEAVRGADPGLYGISGGGK